jgi:hypothetical protein
MPSFQARFAPLILPPLRPSGGADKKRPLAAVTGSDQTQKFLERHKYSPDRQKAQQIVRLAGYLCRSGEVPICLRRRAAAELSFPAAELRGWSA